MLRNIRQISFVVFLLLSSCSTVSKVNQVKVNEDQAKKWFEQYCSKGVRAQSGRVVITSNSRDFKGQFPAELRFQKTGSFVLEATALLGGTLMRLSSDGRELQVVIPSKPELNRSHITHYMGLDLPSLSLLLMGDLPCPKEWRSGGLRVEGTRMQILTSEWKWSFEKSDLVSGEIPIRVVLDSAKTDTETYSIELQIQDWNKDEHYAKKVSIKSPDGVFRWTWRNRQLD